MGVVVEEAGRGAEGGGNLRVEGGQRGQEEVRLRNQIVIRRPRGMTEGGVEEEEEGEVGEGRQLEDGFDVSVLRVINLH